MVMLSITSRLKELVQVQRRYFGLLILVDVSGVSTNFEGAKLVDKDMMRLVEDVGSCCSCLVMYAPRSSERVRLTFRSGVDLTSK